MQFNLLKDRSLISQLLKRDIQVRYRGSVLGLLWSFATPLLMLFVYTFVFEFVFKARWPQTTTAGATLDFTVVLFQGLIIHGALSDVLGRSASIICSNVNFVKKIVFPLYTLPVVVILSSIFNMLIGFLLLIMFMIYQGMQVSLLAMWVPVILMFYVFVLLGLALFFAALGVYLRDVQQIIGTAATLLLFVSPVFYSISILPVWLQHLIMFNPISIPVEAIRALLLYGVVPDLLPVVIYGFSSLLVLAVGWWVFHKARPGFADVI